MDRRLNILHPPAQDRRVPIRSVLAQNPDQKKFDVQLFVRRPKERHRRVSRGDPKMALVARHKEPNFTHRKEV
jgi:hypothetical protein